MHNLPVTKAVLGLLRTRGIQPRPRWVVLLWRAVLWLFSVLSIAASGVIAGAFLTVVIEEDWVGAAHYPGGIPGFVWQLSWDWLMIAVISLITSFYAFRAVPQGYRYHARWIIAASLVVTLVFGSGLAFADLPHETLVRSLAHYAGEWHEWKIWQRPQAGIVSGVIQTAPAMSDANAQDSFMLRANNGEIYSIGLDDTETSDLVGLTIGESVRVIGEQTADHTIAADFIRPMQRIAQPALMQNHEK